MEKRHMVWVAPQVRASEERHAHHMACTGGSIASIAGDNGYACKTGDAVTACGNGNSDTHNTWYNENCFGGGDIATSGTCSSTGNGVQGGSGYVCYQGTTGGSCDAVGSAAGV